MSPSEIMFCPKCNAKLLNAPGIGPYCPNMSCEIIDGFFEEVNESKTS